MTLAVAIGAAACSTEVEDDTVIDSQMPCNPSNPAPTFTQLYTKYLAPGTPGHCANGGCHGNPDHNVWLCGPNKDACYAGMLAQKLINPANPVASLIADPRRSPLIWINPNGFMPQDKLSPFPEGRDAILAWAQACAQNN